MGYRSDVHVVFYVRQQTNVTTPLPYAALKLWVDENYPLKEAEDEWGAEVTYEPEQGYIYIRYYDVKWYPLEHTSAVDETLGRFSGTFDNEANGSSPALAACEFVRIGENLEDIEERHSGWSDYRLNVRREVYFH